MSVIPKIMMMVWAGGLVLGSGLPVRSEADAPLPKGPHRAVVEETCTPCHSAAIILQNRMNRPRWDETITWMQEQQGLGRLTPGIRNQILDYLESVRGLTPLSGKPILRTNPMYEFDYPPNPL